MTETSTIEKNRRPEFRGFGLMKRIVLGVRQRGILRYGVHVLRGLWKELRPRRCKSARVCQSYVEGANGLEIGGPSQMFSRTGLIPAYPFAARIDGLNFSAETLWAEGLGEDKPYTHAGKALGRQYIREASQFPDIQSSSYDFVLSSHVIEHLANPLRGLQEWRRVLRDGGILILVAPHFEGTFDHRRPVTTIEHILEDFAKKIGEDDKTHIAEVLELHDLKRDPWAESWEKFEERCKNNASIRGVHHHVFDTETLVRLVDHADYRIMAVEHAKPESIVIVCSKLGAEDKARNASFLDFSAEWRRSSPFKSDRSAKPGL